MRLKSIIQGGLIISILSTSTFAIGRQIACPPANLIKNSWQKINTVTINDNKTFSVSSTYDIYDEGSNLWWSIGSIDANASDFNTAFTSGQNNVANTFSQKDRYAIETPIGYLCRYLDRNGNYATYTYTTYTQNEHSNKIKEAILSLQH